MRKCVQIARQCDIDMMLLIYDKSNNRFKEVHTNQEMTIESVNEILKKPKAPKYRRVYAGEIFKEAGIDDQDDAKDEEFDDEIEEDNASDDQETQESSPQNIQT